MGEGEKSRVCAAWHGEEARLSRLPPSRLCATCPQNRAQLTHLGPHEWCGSPRAAGGLRGANEGVLRRFVVLVVVIAALIPPSLLLASSAPFVSVERPDVEISSDIVRHRVQPARCRARAVGERSVCAGFESNRIESSSLCASVTCRTWAHQHTLPHLQGREPTHHTRRRRASPRSFSRSGLTGSCRRTTTSSRASAPSSIPA